MSLGHPLTNDQLNATFKDLDVDNDGTISFDEFYAFWTGAGRSVVSEGLRMRLLVAKGSAFMANIFKDFVEHKSEGVRLTVPYL